MNAWLIPGPWHALLLILAAYRLTRFVGWDEWPPAARLRARLIGELWVPDPQMQERIDAMAADLAVVHTVGKLSSGPDSTSPGLPGKQPTSEVAEVRPGYRRPVLAHLIHCPFCIGWWVSLTVYIGWLAAPRPTLYAMTPFAISGAVGLIAKNLDP